MAPDPGIAEEIRRFQEQYDRNPESFAFARLADAYRKAGEPGRALELLERGLRRHPYYLSAHIVRARALGELGRRDETTAAYRRVLDLDPQNLVALRAVAELAREAGLLDEAIAAYRRLHEIEPLDEALGERLAELERNRSWERAANGPDRGAAERPAPARPDDAPAGPAEEPAARAPMEPPPVEGPPAAGPPEAVAAEGPGEPADSSPGADQASGGLEDAAASGSAAPRRADEAQNDAPRDERRGGQGNEDVGEQGRAGRRAEEGREEKREEEEEKREAEREEEEEDLVVTATMGELFLRQELYEQAVRVFERLLERRPDDPFIAEKLDTARRLARGRRPEGSPRGRGAGDDRRPGRAPPARPDVPPGAEPAAAGPEGASLGEAAPTADADDPGEKAPVGDGEPGAPGHESDGAELRDPTIREYLVSLLEGRAQPESTASASRFARWLRRSYDG